MNAATGEIVMLLIGIAIGWCVHRPNHPASGQHRKDDDRDRDH